MQTKEAYKQQLESQLRVSDAQLSLLAANLKNSTEDARLATLLRQLDDIERQKRELREQIQAHENDSGLIWGKTQHDCRLHLK
jgi:hypothetical protein